MCTLTPSSKDYFILDFLDPCDISMNIRINDFLLDKFLINYFTNLLHKYKLLLFLLLW